VSKAHDPHWFNLARDWECVKKKALLTILLFARPSLIKGSHRLRLDSWHPHWGKIILSTWWDKGLGQQCIPFLLAWAGNNLVLDECLIVKFR